MKKRFLATIMASAMIFSTMLSNTAFAAEVPDTGTVITEEYSITREQIAEMMDCTVDEIEDMSFIATFIDTNNPTVTPYSIEIPANSDAVTVDERRVSGGTTKGNEFQIKGDRFMWLMGATAMNNNYVSITGNLYAKGSGGAQRTLSVTNGNQANTGFMNATRNTTFYVEYTVPQGVTGVVVSLVACYNTSK